MSRHLEKDLNKLRKKLLLLSALVEDSTIKALAYVRTREDNLVAEVLALEVRINEMEVDIEEDCLKVLALHQPVAIDLRFLIVVLKVNNDLERMGDQAINILNRVNAMEDIADLREKLALTTMSKTVLEMVRGSLDALINQDVRLAKEIVCLDDTVDDYHANVHVILKDYVMAYPSAVASAMSFATISANLERIGDLCTNIAEEVIFMIEGEVVRHQ